MGEYLLEPSKILQLTDILRLQQIFWKTDGTFEMVKIQNASNNKLTFKSESRNPLHAAESVNVFTMRARRGYFKYSKEEKYAQVQKPLISLLLSVLIFRIRNVCV